MIEHLVAKTNTRCSCITVGGTLIHTCYEALPVTTEYHQRLTLKTPHFDISRRYTDHRPQHRLDNCSLVQYNAFHLIITLEVLC